MTSAITAGTLTTDFTVTRFAVACAMFTVVVVALWLIEKAARRG